MPRKNFNQTTLDRILKASRRRQQADADWRNFIIQAVSEGITIREVAKVAGISHARVGQIVKEGLKENARVRSG